MSGSYSEGTLKLHTNRKQYLTTYSKADLLKFATRESFCDALISCFNATSKVASEITTCIQLYSQKLYVIFQLTGGGNTETYSSSARRIARKPSSWLHCKRFPIHFPNQLAADNRYSWLDVETAEVIFPADFRWSPDSIARGRNCCS